MKLVTADKMRELDNLTIEKHGVPGIVLMERAGKGAFDLLLKCFTEEANAGIVVVCGGGNNGGDGFVLARYAHENSIPVKIILLAKPTTLKGAALENYQKITDKVPVELLSDAANAQQVTERFGNAGCIVDAIFGTGFRREADGLYKVVIEAINNANRRIIAIDIPSGLNPDTGEAMGCAVRADLTVTFGLPKIGQAMYAAGGCLGRLEVVDIGIPQEEIKRIKSNAEIFIIDDLRQLIKPRKWDAHKGNFGHLMIIAGSHGKTGAAVMVAAAALRTGAGLVTLAAPKSLGAIFEAKTTEAMTVNIEDKRKGFFGPGSIKNLMKALEDKNAIALGPGIGTDPDTASFMKKFLERIKMPAVIDADGLNCISKDLSILKKAKTPLILTPHPGEMSRLCKIPKEKIQNDRIKTALDFSKKYGCILVLKGARTVTSSPEGIYTVNTTGNPGMATGGMGDILTGIIGSLLAQGYSAYDAARIGAFVHGFSADRLARNYGPFGYLATEVADEIPGIWKEII